MKTSGIATFLMVSIFFFGLSTQARPKTEGNKVLLEKVFEINTNAGLHIEHEFGKIICSNWDRNAIGIKITAHWKVNNESQIQEMLDKVQMEVHGNMNEVVVRCKPGGKQSNKHNSISLVLEVQMPKTIHLELSQKFGSAFIGTVDGAANISSEYGSLQMTALNNVNNKIRVEFGSGTLQHLTAGKINISYSSFELKTAGDISVSSEFSDFSVSQKVRNLAIELTGGNLEVSKVAELKLEAEYSNAEIDKLSDAAFIESGYGGVDIQNISPDFTTISVENEFGSVDLQIDESAVYTFEAEAEYGEISFPDKNADLSYQKRTTSKSTFKGVIGKGKPKSKVTIESRYGGVSISN